MESITADPVKDLEPSVPDTRNGIASTTGITAIDIAVEKELDPETGNLTESTTAKTIAIIEMEANTPKAVRVLNMGGNINQNIERMKEQGRGILTLCRHSRAGIAPERMEEMRKRFADARLYLDWLDTNLEMTPRIHTSTGVGLALSKLTDPANNAPEEMAQQAKELLNKYEADNWGQDLVPDDDPAAQEASTEAPSIGIVQLPAANDPIFGEGGIMYGVVTHTSGTRRDYRLRVDIPRKSAKVYGHNDIALGAWFPFQINAIFWGAHGARMAGIAGAVTTGAWSIVIAGTYEDLDTDNGDIVYYSGSNSHENTNPERPAPASQGTKALHASIATQNPVRVLRSGGASNVHRQNKYLPMCGLRYDGLYRVVLSRHRTNKNGGLYEQFKLERLPGQTPLAELQRTSPTTAQKFAHASLSAKNQRPG